MVRLRTEADLPACEQLIRVVYDLDGYPGHWPRDLRAFLDGPTALAAWVAVSGDDVVGHVALQAESTAAVMNLATAVTGLPPDRLGVVARLFISPASRRQGVGSALLDTAEAYARSHHRHPILDVVTRFGAAITLYERRGWTRAGMVTHGIGDGVTLDEFVYVAAAGT
jgi:GNAT superfamily N-acetyltransferase